MRGRLTRPARRRVVTCSRDGCGRIATRSALRLSGGRRYCDDDPRCVAEASALILSARARRARAIEEERMAQDHPEPGDRSVPADPDDLLFAYGEAAQDLEFRMKELARAQRNALATQVRARTLEVALSNLMKAARVRIVSDRYGYVYIREFVPGSGVRVSRVSVPGAGALALGHDAMDPVPEKETYEDVAAAFEAAIRDVERGADGTAAAHDHDPGQVHSKTLGALLPHNTITCDEDEGPSPMPAGPSRDVITGTGFSPIQDDPRSPIGGVIHHPGS